MVEHCVAKKKEEKKKGEINTSTPLDFILKNKKIHWPSLYFQKLLIYIDSPMFSYLHTLLSSLPLIVTKYVYDIVKII
jgi:hypothetical protein